MLHPLCLLIHRGAFAPSKAMWFLADGGGGRHLTFAHDRGGRVFDGAGKDEVRGLGGNRRILLPVITLVAMTPPVLRAGPSPPISSAATCNCRRVTTVAFLEGPWQKKR